MTNNINKSELNILYNIKGDKSSNKKLITLFILIVFLLFLVFQRFPHKRYKIKNDYKKDYQIGDFLNLDNINNNKIMDNILWTLIFNNNNKEENIYYDFKIYLNDKFFNDKNNKKELKKLLNGRIYLGYYQFFLNMYFRILKKENIQTNDLTFNYSNSINLNNNENNEFEIYFKKKILFDCENLICKTNIKIKWNILNFKMFLTQILFKNIKEYYNIIDKIEINLYIFNSEYDKYYKYLKIILIILIIISFIFYINNIKNFKRNFYCFEQRFLIILGFAFILYNDPIFFIKQFISKDLYLFINSFEMILFITLILYFNLIISIRMNYYDGELKYRQNYKIIMFFVLFFLINLLFLVFFGSNDKNNELISIKILKILKFTINILFYIILLITNINYIKVFSKFKIKSNRTKGLILFSFLFSIIFNQNFLTTYNTYKGFINTKIYFQVIINIYFIFLTYFFSFINKNFIKNIQENDDNLSIMTKEDIIELNSNKIKGDLKN